jgi:hypothetical protein
VHPVLDIQSRAMDALFFLKQILPTVNLVLGGFTYYPPPDYYGSVKIDISVPATDIDNINCSEVTASFLIFVEPVDDAPEEVVRSSSPYLN